MNRIILIGNGFDLAHGLKTSYGDFIDDFGKKEKQKFYAQKTMSYTSSYHYKDEFIYIEILHSLMSEFSDNNLFEYFTKSPYGRKITYNNTFLETICTKHMQNWVDIEEEYYQQIKNIVQQKLRKYSDDERKIAIKKLNEDFEKIKHELEEYLYEKIEKKDKSAVKNMRDIFFDNFNLKDFPNKKESLLLEYLYNILEKSDIGYYKDLQYMFNKSYESHYGHPLTTQITKTDVINLFNVQDYLRVKLLEQIFPDHILVLNFNYTNTESMYFNNYINTKKYIPNFISIHIHGELNNENNSIIFGYGDELAEEYKEIENLKDNDFLKNVKSINYLKTDNYKRLLNFADSDYFQIYILGHSCGNSDRTLLNTLFEHTNCVSIKPFFYEWEDEKGVKQNDYEEKIMNISRNFNNKKAFREKVVNETYCRPLPQIK